MNTQEQTGTEIPMQRFAGDASADLFYTDNRMGVEPCIVSAPSETGTHTALSLVLHTGWADTCQVSLDSALLHARFAQQGKRTHRTFMPHYNHRM